MREDPIFLEGRSAFGAGLTQTYNPYNPKTESWEATLWSEGFADASNEYEAFQESMTEFDKSVEEAKRKDGIG